MAVTKPGLAGLCLNRDGATPGLWHVGPSEVSPCPMERHGAWHLGPNLGSGRAVSPLPSLQ